MKEGGLGREMEKKEEGGGKDNGVGGGRSKGWREGKGKETEKRDTEERGMEKCDMERGIRDREEGEEREERTR